MKKITECSKWVIGDVELNCVTEEKVTCENKNNEDMNKMKARICFDYKEERKGTVENLFSKGYNIHKTTQFQKVDYYEEGLQLDFPKTEKVELTFLDVDIVSYEYKENKNEFLPGKWYQCEVAISNM